MKSQIAQTPRGLVEYTLLGSGPAVLICHGTSSDCYSSELSEPLVKSGLCVLTPSRPGYGRTPLEVGQSAAQAAEAMVALLDSLEIQTCSVIAISGGGPTGIALAAGYPQRVERLVLAAAISKPEDRPNEPNYKNQTTFYGPMHSVIWGMLGLMSRLSPRSMARQTLTIFSSHNPDDGMSELTAEDIENISRFYQRRSSRPGALTDMRHTVGRELLIKISQPAMVVHSREDASVPFSHAEWALENIPQAELCDAGCTGHFFWIGLDFARISRRMATFLHGEAE